MDELIYEAKSERPCEYPHCNHLDKTVKPGQIGIRSTTLKAKDWIVLEFYHKDCWEFYHQDCWELNKKGASK